MDSVVISGIEVGVRPSVEKRESQDVASGRRVVGSRQGECSSEKGKGVVGGS